jgi:hypothetical protein
MRTIFISFIILIFTLSQNCLALEEKMVKQTVVTRSHAEKTSYYLKDMEKLLAEVKSNFTLYGQPITPKAIQLFDAWISDVIPTVYSIDLNATINSNQSFGNIYISNSEICKRKTYKVKQEDNGFYEYAVIGKLSNQMFVLITRENDGGKFTRVNLKVLDLSMKSIYAGNFYNSESYDGFKKNKDPEKNVKPLPRYLIAANLIYDYDLSMLGEICQLQNDILTIKQDSNEYSIDLTPITNETTCNYN